MKRIILLFAISLFFTLISLVKAQDYVNFPTKNAFWSIITCEIGSFVPKSGLVKVGVFGDTVINSKTYHKLYLQRKYVNYNPSCDTCGFEFNLDSAFYFMSYREENKIIYFVPQQNGFGDIEGTEYTVFDFNLTEIGQKIKAYEFVFIPFGTINNPKPTPGCGSMQDTVSLTVRSIDKVLMSDGTYRRRINFEPLTYGREESWIEGIGSTKGYAFSLDITNSNSTMICFSHNGILLDSKEIFSSQLCNFLPESLLNYNNKCEFTKANLTQEENKDEFSIIPNPIIKQFKIKGIEPSQSIRIYNSYGQLLVEKTAISNEIFIEDLELSQGIYFVTVISQGKCINTGKIMKYK